MVCIRPRRCAWMLAYAIALLAGHASAQPARSHNAHDTAPRPWAAGVPARDQTTAFELYRAGNVDFTESRHAEALAKYREAIQHWDHPQIRFNIAVSLIHLDQPVEASENLERSLRFGAAALGDSLYTQGLTYQKLLDAQLVRLTVASDEPGARVTLDGKFLFIAPGRMVQVVLPGEHQLVATKDGQSTNAETFILGAGKPRLYAIRPLGEARVEPKYVAQDPCSVPRSTPPTTTTASNAARDATKASALSQPPPAPINHQTQASTVPMSLQSNGAIWRVADPSPQASASPSSTASPFSWAALVKKALEPTPAPSATASSRSPSTSTASSSAPTSTASSAQLTTATPLSTSAPLSFPSPPIPVYPVPPPPPAYPTTPSYQPPFAPPYPAGYQPPPGVPPTPTYPTPAYPTPTPSYSPPTPAYPTPTPSYSPPTPAYQPPSYSPPRPPSYQPPLPPGMQPNGSPACTSASPQACTPQPAPPFQPPLPPGYSPPPLPGPPPIPTGRRATTPSTTRAPASLPQATAPQSPRPGRAPVVRPPAATPHTPAVRPTTQTRSTSAPSSPPSRSSSSSHSSGTFRR